MKKSTFTVMAGTMLTFMGVSVVAETYNLYVSHAFMALGAVALVSLVGTFAVTIDDGEGAIWRR